MYSSSRDASNNKHTRVFELTGSIDSGGDGSEGRAYRGPEQSWESSRFLKWFEITSHPATNRTNWGH
jgi:hypothetical protein